jgi:hypothetical protein
VLRLGNGKGLVLILSLDLDFAASISVTLKRLDIYASPNGVRGSQFRIAKEVKIEWAENGRLGERDAPPFLRGEFNCEMYFISAAQHVEIEGGTQATIGRLKNALALDHPIKARWPWIPQ